MGYFQRPSKKGRKQEVVAGSILGFYRLIFIEKEAGDLEGIYACPGLRSKPREMELVLVTG